MGKTAKAMVYIHYSTTYDYGFCRQHHEFNVNARLQNANQYSREIGISLQYNFNATRSKYKGTGVGNAEKSRL